MYHDKLRKILILSLFTILAIGLSIYAYYQSRSFIDGPQITIFSPKTGISFTKPLVEIRGRAHNISHIELNNRQIFVDEGGFFNEKLLLLNGYNIITIEAEDKFNRHIKKLLELVLLEDLSTGMREPVEIDIETNQSEIATTTDS